MNVSLTPKLEGFIRRKVASGLYNNASEVIREALRLLLERENANAAPATPTPPSKAELLAQLAALEAPLRKRGVATLALFGSTVRGQAHVGSDIDVLIETAADFPFSLVDLAALKNFLEERLGHPVDVVTQAGLEPAIRARVIKEARRVF